MKTRHKFKESLSRTNFLNKFIHGDRIDPSAIDAARDLWKYGLSGRLNLLDGRCFQSPVAFTANQALFFLGRVKRLNKKEKRQYRY